MTRVAPIDVPTPRRIGEYRLVGETKIPKQLKTTETINMPVKITAVLWRLRNATAGNGTRIKSTSDVFGIIVQKGHRILTCALLCRRIEHLSWFRSRHPRVLLRRQCLTISVVFSDWARLRAKRKQWFYGRS